MKAVLIVVEGLGIGELPDASLYSDVGSNTYAAICDAVHLPNLYELGLNNIFGVDAESNPSPLANYGRMRRISAGRDSHIAHQELAGIITYDNPPCFPDSFPAGIIFDLENAFGKEIMGNCAVSIDDLLARYGSDHCKSGKPIVYGSDESVLQISAHEQVIAPVKLYRMCEEARKIMVGEYEVGRIIARPFIGESGNYRFSPNKKEFGIRPRTQSILSRLTVAGVTTICLGRVNEIFADIGVGVHLPAHNDHETGERLLEAMDKYDNAFIYADFKEADVYYERTHDIDGFIKALERVDEYIGKVLNLLGKDDLLIVTSTHGCVSGDNKCRHTREYVPLLLYGKSQINGHDYGTIHGYDRVALTLSDYFSDFVSDKSLLHPLRNMERLQQEIRSKLPAVLKKRKE